MPSLIHSTMRLMPYALTTLVMISAEACAPPRPAPGAIAPAATRGSNADLEADLAVMDALESRRAALVREDALRGLGSSQATNLAEAGAWLAFARDAYVARRRSTAADEAFAEARRVIEGVENAMKKTDVAAVPAAVAPPRQAASASTAPTAPSQRSSAAETSYPQQWSRARALDGATPEVRRLVAQAEIELARAAVGNERDSAAAAMELASRGNDLPAGAVPALAVASRLGAAPAACPLAPHLARARQLLAEAESRQRQHLAALAADSAARAAAEARLAFLAAVRDDDRVRTRPVHFALDKDVLSAASRTLLDKVSAALKAHPGLIVVLEGHTDPRGGVAYNLDLSKRRAASVRNYLAETGLDVSRVEIKGYGLAARRSALSTREAYALDRRVMVRFSMEDGTPIAETEELLDVQVEEARRAARRGGVVSRTARTTTRATTKQAAKPAARQAAKPAARTQNPIPRSTGAQR